MSENTTINFDRITVESTTANGFGGESKADRQAKVRALFAEWGIVYKVGRFLATVVQGKSLAQHMLDGAPPLTPKAITVKGVTLDVNGAKLSMDNVHEWGCPICHSAHGTDVAPSKGRNVNYLAGNEFYYVPKTRKLFTISDSCYGNYVKAQGLASKITDPVQPAVQAKAAKQEAAAAGTK